MPLTLVQYVLGNMLVQWFMLAPKVLNILASKYFLYLALLEYSHSSSRVKVSHLFSDQYMSHAQLLIHLHQAESVVQLLIINTENDVEL